MFVADSQGSFMRRFFMIAMLLTLAAIPNHAQQAAPQPDAPIPADQLAAKKISQPKVIFSVDPEFSDEARRKGIGGLCLVALIVDAQGKPQNVHIVRCTDPVFEENSLKAVAQFRLKPATTQEGKPVPVYATVEIHFRRYDSSGRTNDQLPIRYAFSPPPGTSYSGADAKGVYPLTETAMPPSIIMFADDGYEDLAYAATAVSDTTCDIVLTISAKGKASDPQIIRCVKPALEKPAVQSLLESKYKPGKVNGKAVPMRASIHLESVDAPGKP
jgi:TonB family protein